MYFFVYINDYICIVPICIQKIMSYFRICLKKIIFIFSLSSFLCRATPDLNLIQRSFAEVCIEYKKVPRNAANKTLVGGAFLDERTLVIHDPFLETNPEYKQDCSYSVGMLTSEGEKVWVYADRLFRCRVHDIVFLTLNARVPAQLKFKTATGPLRRCSAQSLSTQLTENAVECQAQLMGPRTVALETSTFPSQLKIASDFELKVHVVDGGYNRNHWTPARILEVSAKDPKVVHFELDLESPSAQPVVLKTEIQQNDPIYAISTGREDNYHTELGWVWERQEGHILHPHTFSDLRRRNVMEVFFKNEFMDESCPIFDERGAFLGLSLTRYPENKPHTTEVIPARKIKGIYEFIKENKIPVLRSIAVYAGALVKAERIAIERLDPTLGAKATGPEFLTIEEPSKHPLCPPSGSILWSANGIILGNNLDILFEEASKGDTVEIVWLEPTPTGYLEKSARLKTYPKWPSI